MKRPQWVPHKSDAPGVLLSLAIGGASLALTYALPKSAFVSDILIALASGALIVNTPLRRLFGLALPSNEREADRYAAGLRFSGKWILRLSIILMGFKLQTQFFGAKEIAIIFGVAAASIPTTFFLTHAMAVVLGIRKPLGDLLAGGTMICGASAVNAIAPVCGAHREEQGIAIGTIFLFSIVALLTFQPIAQLVGLDSAYAGLWSGLAVNDLSSAIAVGQQMGDDGGTMAAAAKSARVLMLAPTLLVFAFIRHVGRSPKQKSLGKSAAEHLPRFLLGYLALAAARVAGDRVFGESGVWKDVVAGDKLVVDLLMVTVAASIGLHLEVGRLLAAGSRALVVGGVASVGMASLTLAMVTLASRGMTAEAALVGAGALLASAVFFRANTGKERDRQSIRARFDTGAPLSLGESVRLLDTLEHDGAIEDATLRRLLSQLYPAIGELIPVRESPLPHGEGCRWITYWEGKTGWALVAVCREPGSATPIHAHPHRLIGKSIEGMIEELRFAEKSDGHLEVTSRKVLSHNDLVETDGLATVHLVRTVGDRAAIDLQLRGPEVGEPGKRFRTGAPLDVDGLSIGAEVATVVEIDDRPGHGGEGAKAGKVAGKVAAA